MSGDVHPRDELSQTRPATGRRVIAVIGIDDYVAWPRLGNARSDAVGVQQVFLQLGFIEVTPPLLDRDATHQAMHRLVADDLRTRLSPDDSLVLFFAGHGRTETTRLGGKLVKTGYAIPADAEPPGDRMASWIRLDAWLSNAARLPPRHILVILDACYSGVALGAVKFRDAELPTDPVDALQLRFSRRIITSALDDQRALDGGPYPHHSLFTGCLIDGLSRDLADGRRQHVTGSELGLYLQRRLRDHTRSTQTPDFGALEHDDRGEFLVPILTGQAPEPADADIAPAFGELLVSGGAARHRGDLALAAKQFIAAASAAADMEHRAAALVLAARVELQRGDLVTAEAYLKQAGGITRSPDTEAEIAVLETRRRRNAGDYNTARALLAGVHPATPESRADLVLEQAALEVDETARRQGFHDAIRLYTEASDPRAAARAELELGYLELGANRVRDAEIHFLDALRALTRLDDAHGIALARCGLGRYFCHIERYGEGRQSLVDALALCDRHRLGDVAITARLELAALEVRTGDLLAATQRLNGALSITDLPPPLVARCEAQLGVIAGEFERPEAARRHLSAALGVYQQLQAWPEVRRCVLALATIELDIGRGAAASRPLLDTRAGASIGELAGFESLLLARLEIADGDKEHGAQQLERLQEHERRSIGIAARYHRARYHLDRREQAAAAPLILEGRRIADELGETMWCWRFDELDARSQRMDGHRDVARARALRAREGYQRIENTAGVERCNKLVGAQAGDKTKPQGPAPAAALWLDVIAVSCVVITTVLALANLFWRNDEDTFLVGVMSLSTGLVAAAVYGHLRHRVRAAWRTVLMLAIGLATATASWMGLPGILGPRGVEVRFEAVVRPHGVVNGIDRPCSGGTVTLGLGRKPRSQAISASGEARFDQVPGAFEGVLVPTTITCTGFRDLASVAVLYGARPSDVVLEPAPVCGDGHVDPGEQCDDGNPISGDGCSSTCRLEPVAPKPVLPPPPTVTRKGPCSITPGAVVESARTDCRRLDPVTDKSLYDSIKDKQLHKEPAYQCTAIYECKR